MAVSILIRGPRIDSGDGGCVTMVDNWGNVTDIGGEQLGNVDSSERSLGRL